MRFMSLCFLSFVMLHSSSSAASQSPEQCWVGGGIANDCGGFLEDPFDSWQVNCHTDLEPAVCAFPTQVGTASCGDELAGPESLGAHTFEYVVYTDSDGDQWTAYQGGGATCGPCAGVPPVAGELPASDCHSQCTDDFCGSHSEEFSDDGCFADEQFDAGPLVAECLAELDGGPGGMVSPVACDALASIDDMTDAFCEGLDACAKCDKAACLRIMDRLHEAKGIADDMLDKAGWSDVSKFGGKCHYWTDKFDNAKCMKPPYADFLKGCISYPKPKVIELEDSILPWHGDGGIRGMRTWWSDHSINLVKNKCTGQCLVFDDGFWGASNGTDLSGGVYDPCKVGRPSMVTSPAGVTSWNEILVGCGCPGKQLPIPPDGKAGPEIWDPRKNPGLPQVGEPKWR